MAQSFADVDTVLSLLASAKIKVNPAQLVETVLQDLITWATSITSSRDEDKQDERQEGLADYVHTSMVNTDGGQNSDFAAEKHLTLYIALLENIVKSKIAETELFDHTAHRLCLPVLTSGVLEAKINSAALFGKTTAVLRLCYPFLTSERRSMIEMLCIDSLSQYVTDKKVQYDAAEIPQVETGKLPILVVIEMVGHILTSYADASSAHQMPQTWLTQVIDLVENSLKVADEQISGRLVSTLLPKLLHAVPDTQDLLKEIWRLTVDLFKEYGQKTFEPVDSGIMSQKPYLILCGLADFFFPVNATDIKLHERLESSPTFWKMLQAGFYHSDLLTRKRTMYLLKRILDLTETSGCELNTSREHGEPVFWWHPDCAKQLSTMWNDYVLLMETLEETQVHVIKPLMPRFHHLVEQSAVVIKGCSLVHTSWLTTIIQRAASHESSFIKRWGIHQMLAVDLEKCPLMKQDGGHKFLTETLVTMLAEASVYYKAVDGLLGELNPGGMLLNQFCLSCFSGLEPGDRAAFFSSFMHNIKLGSWGESALVYVAQALSHLPPAPLFGPSSLPDLRDIIVIASTFKPHCRGAIQSFLLTLVINTMDMDTVGPAQYAVFLASLSHEECFQRGMPEWTHACSVFTRASDKPGWTSDTLRSYLSTSIDQILKVNHQDEGVHLTGDDCLPLVRLLLLTSDAAYLPRTDADGNVSVLEVILQPVVSVLTTMNTHAYMPAAKAHRALALLVTLLQEATPCVASAVTGQMDSVRCTLQKLVDPLSNDILLFLQTRVDENKQLLDLSSVDIYTTCVKAFILHAPEKFISSTFFLALLKKCVGVIGEPQPAQVTVEMQVRRYTAMSLLASLHPAFSPTYQHLLVLDGGIRQFFDAWMPASEFRKPAVGLHSDANQQLSSKRQQNTVAWGKLSCDYLSAQWLCIEHMVLRQGHDLAMSQVSAYHEACVSMLDLISVEGYGPILGCLQLLLPKLDDESRCSTLNEVWHRVGSLRRNVHFWPAYEKFVQLAFQPTMLEVSQDSQTYQALINCAKGIFKIGEERNGIVTLLVRELYNYSVSKPDSCRHLHKFISLIIDLLIFGPIHSKSNRTAQEVLQYIDTLGDEVSVNHLLSGQLRGDNMVRVHMQTMLSRLRPDNPEHESFVMSLVPKLIDRIDELRRIKTYRNFSNSLGHRVKHRLICVLLILNHHISKNLAGIVMSFCEELLLKENQASIRAMVEWILILILHRTMKLDWIWSALKEMGENEKNGACTCSILMIVCHLAKLIEDKTVQESFIMSAFERVLPLCMVIQLNVRTFAQGTLMSLWYIAQENKLDNVMASHSIIKSFVDVHKRNGIYKSMNKLLSNFWLVFHPLEDLSVQTICKTLPWLTGIVDEEWLPLKLFMQVEQSWCNDPSSHSVPLLNSRQVLDTCEPGSWRIKAGPGDDTDDAKDGDFQKKMMPWRLMLPEADLGLDLEDDYSKKKQKMGGLILVTSLIDKIPNLGGLCRTCEIFGVSEYVIGSLKFTEDKQFEQLSVSAHKWLPITEVKVALLKNYLWEMKQEGYTLVGAEQTANSTSLVNYNFPKKTLLLLGNEREGIPVDLIQLLDVCVEIPQLGITRSLNVHVSGALLIWEYARQHLTH